MGWIMFYNFIALRYLKGRKKIFFTFSNMLSLFGIILGVFSLLVVSSVMNGFDSDMRSRVIGTKAEIKIYNENYLPLTSFTDIADKLESLPFISGISPVCENELLIQNEKQISTSVCYGIDWNEHKNVTQLLDKIVVGNPTSELLNEDGIILGLEQSISLRVTVGEYVQVSSPLGTEPTPFGLLPRNRRFKVIGLFISGLPEFDRIYSYISLKNAQYLGRLKNEVNYLEVKTINMNKAEKYSTLIDNELENNYLVENWSNFEANLFNAIKMEKMVMFLVLALMLLIASFNMSGNFIRLVAEKKTEIGILKAMGASDKDIIRIFSRIGLMLGALGTAIGFSSALILLLAQAKWHFITIPVPGFALHWLPVELRLSDFIGVPIITLIISLLTTLYPARKTIQINPIRTIRNQ